MSKSHYPNFIFFYDSPIGKLEIQLKDDQVYSISKKISCLSSVDVKSQSPAVRKNQKTSKLIHKLVLFLDKYFSENKIPVENLPLFSRGTVFQQKVWKFLREIPYGQTRSYAQVAKSIGSSGAARAVGSACSKNPWLILIPCHRIVAQKDLGGFALGLPAKTLLLNHERQA